MKAGNIDK